MGHQTTEDIVVHISKWAITTQNGSLIRKMYFYNNIKKINREIELLRISTGLEVRLFFDNQRCNWVSETNYLELNDLFENRRTDETINLLKTMFERWEQDGRYRKLVESEWEASVVPWYCNILQRYFPEPESIIAYLQQTKGTHFVHGDFLLSNVKKNSHNEIVVLDFENAVLGPLLWDETTLVYSAIEEKRYSIAKHLFDSFACTDDMLRAIAAIRLSQSIKKQQNENIREDAFQFVKENFTHCSF